MRIKRGIFVIIIALVFLISTPIVSSARAGGGGGGGSSGGGGGGGSHSSSSSGSGNSSSPISSIVTISIFALASSGGIIAYKVRIYKKNRVSKKLIRELERIDKDWNYSELKNRVEESFYKIQEAWTKRDIDIAENYISKDLYELHRSKIEWMKVRHEINVLKGIKLISTLPIGVIDLEDESEDLIWFYVKGAMADYYIDDRNGRYIKGSRRRESFEEYWKFVRSWDTWVLDEIRQIDDVDESFFESITDGSQYSFKKEENNQKKL